MHPVFRSLLAVCAGVALATPPAGALQDGTLGRDSSGVIRIVFKIPQSVEVPSPRIISLVSNNIGQLGIVRYCIVSPNEGDRMMPGTKTVRTLTGGVTITTLPTGDCRARRARLGRKRATSYRTTLRKAGNGPLPVSLDLLLKPE